MVQSSEWVAVTKPCEIKLDGIDAEFEFADKTVNSITVRDANGNAIRIVRGEYQALKVYVPKPPTLVEKFRLHGELCGVSVDKLYDSYSEARNALDEMDGVSHSVTIEPIKVRE